jgi:hypothetical protein
MASSPRAGALGAAARRDWAVRLQLRAGSEEVRRRLRGPATPAAARRYVRRNAPASRCRNPAKRLWEYGGRPSIHLLQTAYQRGRCSTVSTMPRSPYGGRAPSCGLSTHQRSESLIVMPALVAGIIHALAVSLFDYGEVVLEACSKPCLLNSGHHSEP